MFDRGRRSATIYVFNQGDTPGAVDIQLVDRVMLPDGRIQPVSDGEQDPAVKAAAANVLSAQDLLLISPRRVTLAPRQGQTIRVRLTPAAATATPGEHRSHLTVTTIPPRESGGTADQAAQGATGQLRFQVNAVFGLSVPVIVRVGDPDARAAIENLRLEPTPPSMQGGPILAFDVVRKGASSLYGNVEVRTQGQRRGEPIGIARGVGVYPEIERRTVRLQLARSLAPDERIEVTFTDDDVSPGRILAKAAP